MKIQSNLIFKIKLGSRQQSRFIAMMEDYDRTMELIETAQDSAGKSEEQFAKKADTLDYKITVLKNTFEQLRIELMDQNLFKNLIDGANNFLVKISKLDLKKLLIAAIPMAPIIKTFVSNFTDGLKKSATNFTQAGKAIAQKVAATPLLGRMYKRDNEEITRLENRIRQLQEQASRTQQEDDELAAAQNKLEQLNSKSQAVAQGIESAFQSAVTFITILFSGGEIEDAFNAMGIQLIAANANMGIEMVSQWIKNWATMNTVTAAGGATMAATAGAAGEATGVAIGTGINAGLSATGIGAIVALIGAAIGAALLGVSKLIKNYKENNLTLEQQLDLYKEINEEAERNANLAKNKANEAKEEYENAEKLKETYERLSAVKEKTQAQEEEYAEVVKQIREQFPEIVTYYDETTGQLEVQVDYWNQILETAKEVSEIENKKANAAQSAATSAAYREKNLQYQKTEEELKEQQANIAALAKSLTDYAFYKVTDEETVENYSKEELQREFNNSGIELIVTDSLLKEWNSLTDNINIDEIDQLEEAYVQLIESAYGTNTAFETLNENVKQLEENFKTFKEKDIIDNLKRSENGYSDTVNTVLGKAIAKASEEKQIKIKQYTIDAKYENLDPELAAAVNENIKDKKSYNDLTPEEKKAFISDYQNAYENQILTEYALNIKISNNQANVIDQLYKNQSDYIDNSFEKLLKENRKLPPEIQSSYEEIVGEIQQERNKIKENVSALIGEDANKFADYTTSELQSIQNVIGNFEQTLGEGEAKYFAQQTLKLKDKFDLTTEEYADLMSMDFSNVNLTNIDDFIESIKDKLTCDDETKEKIVNSWIKTAKDVGAINLSTGSSGLEGLMDSMYENFGKKLEVQGKISKIISAQLENGFISFSESNSLRDALKDINMNMEDFLQRNLNGELVLNVDDLKNAFLESSDVVDDLINQAIKENEIQIEQLQAEANILEVLKSQINANNVIIRQEQEQYRLAAEKLVLEGKIKKTNIKDNFTVDSNFTAEDIDEELERIYKNIDQKKANITDINSNKEEIEKQYYSNLNAYLRETAKNFEDLAESSTKELKKVQEAQEKVIEAQKKLNEALYGTENHKDALDLLYNYNINLERMEKKATKAKEALEDLTTAQDRSLLLQQYIEGTRGEIINREAQNRVLQQSIDNRKAVLDSKLNQAIAEINAGGTDRNLSADISDYYTIIGDRLNVNHAAIDNAALPDDLKDYIHEQISTINEEYDQMEENIDAINEKTKEFNEAQKNIRDQYISLEEKVIDTLKQKYEEEVKNNEDKNKALEEADNKYLEALKNNMEKQKKLREENNALEELAEKQKKLSLMQRDTSGANRKDVEKLKKEVEKSQQDTLDKKIDNIIDGLKEFYDLQKETREIEIEYQKAMIDNAQIIKEANELINSWQGPEDMIEWMLNNQKDLSEKTQAQIDAEKDSWEELFNAKDLYLASSSIDFSNALLVQENEIAETIRNTSEVLTQEADRSLNEIKDSVSEAIKSAEKELQDAIDALNEANGSGGGSSYVTPSQSQSSSSQPAIPTITPNTPDWGKAKDAMDKANPLGYVLSRNIIDTDSAKKEMDRIIDWLSKTTINGKIYKEQDLKSFFNLVNGKNVAEEDVKIYNTALQKNKWLKDFFELKHNQNAPGYYISKRFATGGLVDFTGPAWVDGTKNKPEAFLSAEDTERIGMAAKLLATIPNLMRNNNTTSSPNIGDTSIEIHINVESIGSDYDVDRLAERVKQDIVNIAQPVGAPIILNKR